VAAGDQALWGYASTTGKACATRLRTRRRASSSPGLSGRRSMKLMSSAAIRIAVSRSPALCFHLALESGADFMLGPGAQLGRNQVLGPLA
jgi:hypothetical protein